MKKLSKIDESAWGDMMRRSSGDTIRKENDVNLLDIEGLYEYIKEKYNKGGHLISVNQTTIKISIAIDYYDLTAPNISIELYWYKNNKNLFIYSSKSVIEDISKEFELQKNSNYYRLKQEGEELTNYIVINVLDSILKSCSNHSDKIEILLDYNKVNESAWGDMMRRSSGDMIRREDLPEQDKEHWWKNIELPNVPKYKKDELKALDLMYDFAVDKIRKKFNVSWPYQIVFHFDYEPYWDLNIEHITPRGYDTFAMYAHGPRAPWQIYFSDMSMGEKRSIRYRLEKKKFYVYPYKYGDGRVEYHLREQSAYNNEKGIELK